VNCSLENRVVRKDLATTRCSHCHDSLTHRSLSKYDWGAAMTIR
jgi:hypothetical protein